MASGSCRLHTSIIFLSCAILTMHKVQAFSAGSFDSTACSTGPQHQTTAQTVKSPFVISVLNDQGVEASTYRPGELLTVRITSQVDEVKVKGFLMWAAPADLTHNYCPLGKWVAGRSEYEHEKNCDLDSPADVVCDAKNNAVSHKTPLDKDYVEALFLVPTEQTAAFIFRAHVVNNFTTFWFSIKSDQLTSVDSLETQTDSLIGNIKGQSELDSTTAALDANLTTKATSNEFDNQTTLETFLQANNSHLNESDLSDPTLSSKTVSSLDFGNTSDIIIQNGTEVEAANETITEIMPFDKTTFLNETQTLPDVNLANTTNIFSHNETDSTSETLAMASNVTKLVNATNSLLETDPMVFNETEFKNATNLLPEIVPLAFNETDFVDGNTTVIKTDTTASNETEFFNNSNVLTEAVTTSSTETDFSNGTDILSEAVTQTFNETQPTNDTSVLIENVTSVSNQTDFSNDTKLLPETVTQTFNETEFTNDTSVLIENVTTLFNQTEFSNDTEILPETVTQTITENELTNETSIVTENTTMVFNQTDFSNDGTEILPELVTQTITENELANETSIVTENTTMVFNQTDFSNGTEILPELVTQTITENELANETSIVTENTTTVFNQTDFSNDTDILPETVTQTFNETELANDTNIFTETTTMVLNGTDSVNETGFGSETVTEPSLMNETDFSNNTGFLPETTTMSSNESVIFTNETDIVPGTTDTVIGNQTDSTLIPLNETEVTATNGTFDVTTVIMTTIFNEMTVEDDNSNSTNVSRPIAGEITTTEMIAESNMTSDSDKTDDIGTNVTTTLATGSELTSTDLQQDTTVATTMKEENETDYTAPDDASSTEKTTEIPDITTPMETTTDRPATFPTESTMAPTPPAPDTTATDAVVTTTPTTIAPTTTPAKPAEKEADKNDQPIQITFKLEGDFGQLVEPNVEKATADLKSQLAKIMDIDEARIIEIRLSSGSVAVALTVEPAEDGSGSTTDEAKAKLEDHLSNGGGLEINGKELQLIDGTLVSKSKSKAEKTPEGMALSTQIIIGVVCGLIGLGIIIAIIVIVLRQRSNHGFLVMRQTRKDQDIAMHNMEGNGRNGNGNSYNNQGYSNP